MTTSAVIEPINSEYGADIVGMDLSEPLSLEQQQWLKKQLDTHYILRFRGQRIDPEVQVSILSSFGAIVPNSDGREYYYVSNAEPVSSKVNLLGSNGELLWHADYMWSATTLHALSLYAEKVVPPVAPTLFTCAAAALDRLSPELLRGVRGVSAEQTSNGWTSRAKEDHSTMLETVWNGQEPLVTPLIATNPRTQAPYLCASEMHTRRIVGMDEEEGEELLTQLFDVLYDPRHVLIHDWQDDDLVVWDNIAMQHSRPNVSESGIRHLRKVNAGGSIPDRQFQVASS